MNVSKIYKRLSKSLAQLVSLAKMYNLEHPIVKEKMQNVYKDLKDFFSESKQSIVLAKSADMLLMNGEKVETIDKLMMRFVEDFVTLDIGSLELETGLTQEELGVFVQVMCHVGNITGSEKIKNFLTEKKAVHLVARAATFKLVQENEDIVKKGESVNIDELPAEVVKIFSKDLAEGKVPEKLKSADKDYKKAAHNSTFLAGVAFDLIKDKDSPEDLEKVLWLLADYLVDEIGTFKEENMNRKVLEDVRKKLLAIWQEKHGKAEMTENIHKTYDVINTALQVKGLIVLYKKHRKELEASVKKIRGILNNLPSDSKLCQRAIEELAGMGKLSIDENTFKCSGGGIFSEEGTGSS